ncbi:hypothetical protein AXG93_4776s1270 [Marchantia polymorpha subsp. ruderalis]|uniref:Uncharacterized protein n=1 Tax=Marchantia polymorpha subsp. ruderalis TaxID=1480154 RepID=A0A176VTK9_MARPO|nr:hypothetical protein AXG93_4776s1270 [Marchantia polymorpha subsp. ruderalis]
MSQEEILCHAKWAGIWKSRRRPYMNFTYSYKSFLETESPHQDQGNTKAEGLTRPKKPKRFISSSLRFHPGYLVRIRHTFELLQDIYCFCCPNDPSTLTRILAIQDGVWGHKIRAFAFLPTCSPEPATLTGTIIKPPSASEVTTVDTDIAIERTDMAGTHPISVNGPFIAASRVSKPHRRTWRVIATDAYGNVDT